MKGVAWREGWREELARGGSLRVEAAPGRGRRTIVRKGASGGVRSAARRFLAHFLADRAYNPCPMANSGSVLQQRHDEFLAAEEAEGLFEERAYDRHYWHDVRWDIWGGVQQALGLSGPKQRTWRSRPLRTWLRPEVDRLGENLRRSRWDDLGPADLLVFNHPRHVFDRGSWSCAYSEPLLRDLPYSRWVIEQSFQGLHYAPNSTAGLKYIEWQKWQEYARFALRDAWRGGRLRQTEVRRVRDWAGKLRRRLGGGPSDEQALARVRTAVRRKVALGELFERLLDRVQPRVILHVVHYSFRSLVMTPLAKARGIPVVELQHGFIGPTHLAYNFAEGRKPVAFPDHLLLFGDLWRDMTPGLPLPKERTPAVGFLRLEQLKAAARSPAVGGPTQVLFISQPAIGEALSRIAKEVASACDPEKLRIVYRLHPGEMQDWRSRYPWLVDAPLLVADAPGDDLYDWFLRSQVQVGVYSTALFEGLAFGLPTAIVALPGHENLAVLLERGLATLHTGATELSAYLQQGPVAPPSQQLSRIWQPGAQQNFASFLAGVLGG